VDNDLTQKIYIKARATPKVVADFAESSEFDKILMYSITPDCSRMMQLTQVQFCWEILRNTRKWEDDCRASVTFLLQVKKLIREMLLVQLLLLAKVTLCVMMPDHPKCR
jgi:hypothetical protein